MNTLKTIARTISFTGFAISLLSASLFAYLYASVTGVTVSIAAYKVKEDQYSDDDDNDDDNDDDDGDDGNDDDDLEYDHHR